MAGSVETLVTSPGVAAAARGGRPCVSSGWASHYGPCV